MPTVNEIRFKCDLYIRVEDFANIYTLKGSLSELFKKKLGPIDVRVINKENAEGGINIRIESYNCMEEKYC